MFTKLSHDLGQRKTDFSTLLLYMDRFKERNECFASAQIWQTLKMNGA